MPPVTTTRDFDVVVIGGGHAGVEAALAAARMGAATACVVLDPGAMGRMSCNPAIGGIAKGQLVREVDALGGEMGLCADHSGIQFRMLNTKKGPAMRSPRAQCDRAAYNAYMTAVMGAQPGLTILAGEASAILTDRVRRRVRGVRLADEDTILAPAVVLTTGTFLGGRLFAGEWEQAGGRLGERGATKLSQGLLALGLRLGRHKTGTPPRLVKQTIDFQRLHEQRGDEVPQPFSFRNREAFGRGAPEMPQVSCWLTRTNHETHRVIENGAHLSPMYQGRIVGRGPRYCPSVEDKVMRFRDQESHLIFLEPEGLCADEIYPNGLSTSLPVAVQEQFLRTIHGLEHVEIARPGYAVEYDYLLTDQIRADLHVADIVGLYAAGQINGTSGYEEAAAQGLIAGINAVRFGRREAPLILDRASSYIGVMIDDLCRVNPDEPYRMFTSRAEFRLLLRSDNADRRLSALGSELRLLDRTAHEQVQAKEAHIEAAVTLMEQTARNGRSLAAILRRPDVTMADLLTREPGLRQLSLDAAEVSEVEAEIKYAGYIKRQAMEVDRMRRLEGRKIPGDFDYDTITGLSSEAREHLHRRQPQTLGEASRIPGVRPADLNLLLVMLAKSDRQPGTRLSSEAPA
jgi:tRNA uridine 5-carboxymethylaminomethyl modification enzyme